MSKDMAKEIIDLIGENDDKQEVTEWVSTGYPELDKAISGSYFGGLPVGRIIEIAGPESSGKTAIATQAMIAGQSLGGIAVFLDHENSFDVGLASGQGLKTERGFWVYKQPSTFEEAITVCTRLGNLVRTKKLIEPTAPIVCVFDSLASMVPQSKLDKEAGDYNMNDNTALARATSAAFPALVQIANKNNMCLIFLNQTRTKIGVAFGDPTTTPGGSSPKFYASVRIILSRAMEKTGKETTGQKINARVIKNKVSAPFKRASWSFKFMPDGTGKFDVIGSLLDHMTDVGLIEKAGSRIVWEGTKPYKSELAALAEKDSSVRERLFKMLEEADDKIVLDADKKEDDEDDDLI